MKDHLTKKELKPIRISAELYENLRQYCDKMDIRFKDFIENALESATYYEELSNMLQESKRALRNITDEREKAYHRGFQKGFCSALYAVQGNLEMSLDSDNKKQMEKHSRFRSVEGPQLELF